jgi:uncharacterized membrane protein
MSVFRGGSVVAFGTALLVALYAARVGRTGETVFGFLLFNLALAWIPWVVAHVSGACARRGWIAGAWAIGAVWLLFLPNAPYLLTDFVHLRERHGVPLWYDIALLGTAALTGLAAGAFSMQTMREWIAERHGARAALGAIVLSAALCGVGIYLGRFERWSSWDIVVAPLEVATDLARVATSRRAIVASAVFGSITMFVYLAVSARAPSGPARPETREGQAPGVRSASGA